MNFLWILLSLITAALSAPVDPWFPSPDCPANQPYWCPNLQGCYSLEERPDDCYRPAASARTQALESPPVCTESVFHVWCSELKSCVLLEDYQKKCIDHMKVLGAQGKTQEKPNTPIPSVHVISKAYFLVLSRLSGLSYSSWFRQG